MGKRSTFRGSKNIWLQTDPSTVFIESSKISSFFLNNLFVSDNIFFVDESVIVRISSYYCLVVCNHIAIARHRFFQIGLISKNQVAQFGYFLYQLSGNDFVLLTLDLTSLDSSNYCCVVCKPFANARHRFFQIGLINKIRYQNARRWILSLTTLQKRFLITHS